MEPIQEPWWQAYQSYISVNDNGVLNFLPMPAEPQKKPRTSKPGNVTTTTRITRYLQRHVIDGKTQAQLEANIRNTGLSGTTASRYVVILKNFLTKWFDENPEGEPTIEDVIKGALVGPQFEEWPGWAVVLKY